MNLFNIISARICRLLNIGLSKYFQRSQSARIWFHRLAAAPTRIELLLKFIQQSFYFVITKKRIKSIKITKVLLIDFDNNDT